MVFEAKYDYAYSFNENRSEVQIDLKYGHIKQKGKPITKLIYTETSSFRNGVATLFMNHFILQCTSI